MAAKESQQKDQPPVPKRDNFWVPIYEMRTTSEVVKDWLPWRKKNRKRD